MTGSSRAIALLDVELAARRADDEARVCSMLDRALRVAAGCGHSSRAGAAALDRADLPARDPQRRRRMRRVAASYSTEASYDLSFHSARVPRQ